MSSPDSRGGMWRCALSRGLAGNVAAKQNHKGAGQRAGGGHPYQGPAHPVPHTEGMWGVDASWAELRW